MKPLITLLEKTLESLNENEIIVAQSMSAMFDVNAPWTVSYVRKEFATKLEAEKIAKKLRRAPLKSNLGRRMSEGRYVDDLIGLSKIEPKIKIRESQFSNDDLPIYFSAEITSWNSEDLVRKPGFKDGVVPLKYASDFAKKYRIRNIKAKSWFKDSGGLKIEFELSWEDANNFIKKYFDKSGRGLHVLPIKPGVEAVRWEASNKFIPDAIDTILYNS